MLLIKSIVQYGNECVRIVLKGHTVKGLLYSTKKEAIQRISNEARDALLAYKPCERLYTTEKVKFYVAI